MKKLMIAAAGAAVGLGAFANEFVPETYEMNITVKTTTCQQGANKVLSEVCEDAVNVTYRKQTTQKIAGFFWGCDCPTISEPKAFETFDDFGTSGESHGYVFWDASDKTKPAYETATFAWSDGDSIDNFLQYFGNSNKDVEGLWQLSLTDSQGDEVVRLQGAGMGNAKWNKSYLVSYINNMSGNVTGWAFPGYLSYGCAACGEVKAGCSAWQFCADCEERDADYPSVAFGSWTLKFNTSAAKKYGNGTTRDAILSAYKFSDKVKAYLIEVDAGFDPEPEERTPAEKTYDTCKANYNAAVAKYDAAVADWAVATTAVGKASYDYNNVKKSAAWIAGTNEIVTLFKDMEAKNKELNVLATNPNYKATADYCATETATYVAATKDYIEKSVALKYYGGNTQATNDVKDAKTAMANAYVALDNKVSEAACPGGSVVKTTLKAAVEAYEDAAEAYFDKAAQYVAKIDIISSVSWKMIDFANCNARFWTAGVKTVCYKGIADVLAAAQKDETAKENAMIAASAAMKEAEDALKTAKIICDATGGDCQ